MFSLELLYLALVLISFKYFFFFSLNARFNYDIKIFLRVDKIEQTYHLSTHTIGSPPLVYTII